MPDLPLPNPTPSGTASPTTKTTDAVRAAIVGESKLSSPAPVSAPVPSPSSTSTSTPLKPLMPKTDLSESKIDLPKPRTTGFVTTPPPAAVTALSSMSGNQPPHQINLEDVSLPRPDRGPVRASATAPSPRLDKTPAEPLVPASSNPNHEKDKSPLINQVANQGKDRNTTDNPVKPKLAMPKQSILRFLPIVAGGLVLLLLVIWLFGKLTGGSQTTSVGKNSGSQTDTNTNSTGDSDQNSTNGSATSQTGSENITLEYWGLWEIESNMEEALKEFEQKNSGITVQYVKQSHKDYRERLQTAIASGNGPDVFRFHASWTPMMINDLASMPSSVFTLAQFKENFYPAAVTQLQQDGQIVGIPLMYDGLMLYYNTDILAAAGEKPPSSWSELRILANKLTLRDGGEIKRAGVALGNASNVDNFSDILALLMLQNGADLFHPNSAEGRDALLFYTNFITKDKVWNEYMPNSTLAFARGDVAMMIAPSWRSHDISGINPDLKFATAPLPQLSNSKITWATYWAEGVNKQSTNKDAAWKLLAYLSSVEGQQKLFATQAQNRAFGEPYSRTDLADSLASHQILGSLVQDAPEAKGWYMSSMTHDNGLNDQIIKYYEDAVNSIIDGKATQAILETLETGVTQVLTQYKVSVPL